MARDYYRSFGERIQMSKIKKSMKKFIEGCNSMTMLEYTSTDIYFKINHLVIGNYIMYDAVVTGLELDLDNG